MTIKILIGFPNFYDWCDYIILLQNIFPNNIFIADFEKDDILHIINKFQINYILSLTYTDMKKIIELEPKNVCILNNNDYNNIDIFDNKGKFAEFFINNELEKHIPKTYKIKYDDYIYNEHISYPAILKSNIGLGGKDIYILKNENDYFNVSSNIIKKNYVVQEFLTSINEYVGHLFYINGKMIYSLFFEIKNDEIYHVRKGPSKNYILVDFNHLEFNEIFEKIKFTGLLNLNFKYINGKIIIFEVNPRLGGSIVKSNYLYDMFNTIINYLTNYNDIQHNHTY